MPVPIWAFHRLAELMDETGREGISFKKEKANNEKRQLVLFTLPDSVDDSTVAAGGGGTAWDKLSQSESDSSEY